MTWVTGSSGSPGHMVLGSLGRWVTKCDPVSCLFLTFPPLPSHDNGGGWGDMTPPHTTGSEAEPQPPANEIPCIRIETPLGKNFARLHIFSVEIFLHPVFRAPIGARVLRLQPHQHHMDDPAMVTRRTMANHFKLGRVYVSPQFPSVKLIHLLLSYRMSKVYDV